MFTGESEDPVLRRVFAEKTADAMLKSRSLLYGEPPVQQAPPAPHALPAPSFRGHAPPGLALRPTYDAPADPPAATKPAPAPAAAPPANGAPTPEELRESEQDDPQANDFGSGGGDDDIPF